MPFIELFLNLGSEEYAKSREVMQKIATFIDNEKILENYSSEDVKDALNSIIALIDLGIDE